jgi:hypothetical protein
VHTSAVFGACSLPMPHRRCTLRGQRGHPREQAGELPSRLRQPGVQPAFAGGVRCRVCIRAPDLLRLPRQFTCPTGPPAIIGSEEMRRRSSLGWSARALAPLMGRKPEENEGGASRTSERRHNGDRAGVRDDARRPAYNYFWRGHQPEMPGTWSGRRDSNPRHPTWKAVGCDSPAKMLPSVGARPFLKRRWSTRPPIVQAGTRAAREPATSIAPLAPPRQALLRKSLRVAASFSPVSHSVL